MNLYLVDVWEETGGKMVCRNYAVIADNESNAIYKTLVNHVHDRVVDTIVIKTRDAYLYDNGENE